MNNNGEMVIEMEKTIVNISRTEFGEVFIQTGVLDESDNYRYTSDCQVDMPEEDCIELAITLSDINYYTEYEDEDYYVTRYSKGNIIKKYKNE